MTDNSLPKVYSPDELETRNLILHVRSRKWRYLLIMLLLGSYFFYIFKYKILEYSSTATFIVNDRTAVASSLGLDGLTTSDNFTRIYELANSINTQMYLIKKFDLIKLYGIDTTREFYLQQVIAMIRSKIMVSKSPQNTISVTVKDSHRYLAADMANEIVRYIEKLNHDYYVSNIQQRLNISQGYTNELEKINRAKTIEIESLIDKINKLVTSGKANQQTTYELLNQQQKLSGIIAYFVTSTNDQVNSQKMYSLALQALNYQNTPTTTLVQEAMPAFRSISYSAAMYSLGAVFGVCLLLVVQGYFYMQYKHYIILLITGR